MTRTCSILVCLLAACPALSAPATLPATRSLTARLSSDDWKTRQEAVEQLVLLGDDALPELYRVLRTSSDWEARLRAEAAIARILDNRLVGASMISMKLEKAPAAKAIEDLARQARAKLISDPPSLLTGGKLKSVTLDADHRPFWEVMQAISRQTGLTPATINKHNRDVGLGLTKGDPNWNAKPIVLAGPLLIRADRLMRVTTVALRDGGNGLNEFTCNMTVFAEPKLKVIDYSGQLHLLEVLDDKGNSLIDQEDLVEADFDVMGSSSSGTPSTWEVGASLHYPKNAGQRISRFRASVSLEIQLRSAKFETPIAGSSGAEKTLDGVRVRLKSLDQNRCLLSVFRDGRTETEWHRLRMMLANAEACLLDDKDRVAARSQQGIDVDFSPDSQRMDLRMRFGRDGGEFSGDAKQKRSDAVKLVWEFPAQTRVLTIPFEFRDLPIPR